MPPQPTAAETAFLNTAYALAQQLDAFQGWLVSVQQQANAGRLDNVDLAEVGALYDELSSARDMIARTPASARLTPYDRMLQAAYDEAVASAELLLRARLTDIPEARMVFVNEAASDVAESSRLEGEANAAYSLALLVIVG